MPTASTGRPARDLPLPGPQLVCLDELVQASILRLNILGSCATPFIPLISVVRPNESVCDVPRLEKAKKTTNTKPMAI